MLTDGTDCRTHVQWLNRTSNAASATIHSYLISIWIPAMRCTIKNRSRDSIVEPSASVRLDAWLPSSLQDLITVRLSFKGYGMRRWNRSRREVDELIRQ